jgi:predicted deacylase
LSAAIEIAAPDISRYRSGNAGADYVQVLDSGKPGPNVMVQALTHGNEYCGAIAVDFLFRERVAPLK